MHTADHGQSVVVGRIHSRGKGGGGGSSGSHDAPVLHTVPGTLVATAGKQQHKQVGGVCVCVRV